MSKEDELIRLTLQKKYQSPTGVRANEETLYANVAHMPLMLDNVRQIEVLQIHDAIEDNIKYKRFGSDEIITPDEPIRNKTIYLYVIDKRTKFNCTDDGLIKYDGVYYTVEELQNKYGITQTRSVVYYIKYGVTKCWFNSVLNQYWDTETSKWYKDPPKYDDGPQPSEKNITIDNIAVQNGIGSIGMFLYIEPGDDVKQFGHEIRGKYLRQISFNSPSNGEFSYSSYDSELTGIYSLLSVANKRPCIVFAVKIRDSITSTQQTVSTQETINNNHQQNVLNSDNNNSSELYYGTHRLYFNKAQSDVFVAKNNYVELFNEYNNNILFESNKSYEVVSIGCEDNRIELFNVSEHDGKLCFYSDIDINISYVDVNVSTITRFTVDYVSL